MSRGERVFIALGSNLGDRAAALEEAIAALARDAGEVAAVSSRHETPALLPPDAPPSWDVPFLNQVIAMDTGLGPGDLLATAKAIEERLGREPSARWAPRKIDIDILAIGDRVIDEPGLKVPHPELHKRAFVLDPWAEIAPTWRHPVRGATVAEMRAALEKRA